MTISRIRFAPDILRRLGEELNPHPSFGIIELVKNSFDADAKKCVVTLTDVDTIGGTVEVIDNGDGMTADQIEQGWLVLGHSQKQQKQKTRLGRIPAGSKGLGRLAALRLGRFATLDTRPRVSATDAYRLQIDWKLFENASLIDDVGLDIEQHGRGSKFGNGTTIKLDKLRDRIGRVEVKRLARAMLLLADPFGDDKIGFQPKLIAPEFSDLEKLVTKRYFDQASFHLVASYDGNGSSSASLRDFKGVELFSANHSDLFPESESRTLSCPALEFEFWTFILNKTTFDTFNATVGEVKEWLTEFGGVHIYQNGLRVSPYGDSGHDWLSINLSRVRSPEERPSTNNSIGRVRLLDHEQMLIQKTDRSGFIETPEFDEIRRFALAALEWMADRRMQLAELKRIKARTAAPERSAKSKENLNKAIESAPQKFRDRLKEAAQQYDRSRDKEVNELKREVQLYRTLSTAGITAATFAHESTGNPIKVIKTSIDTIERRAQERFGDDYSSRLAPAVNRVKESVESLSVLDAVTLSLLEHEKRRPSRVDVHRTIRAILNMFRPFLLGRGVTASTKFSECTPWLHASEAAVESIITNLINNSLAAFESKPSGQRQILVSTIVNQQVVRIGVEDSGEGIIGIRLSDIWLPGKTTRKNGTGLGLTIVKDTVVDFGGEVGAVEVSSLGGAEIYVVLPILGV